MDAIDVVSMPVPDRSSHLGPMAGAWDGYGAMDDESRIRAECLVGVIHMKAVESAQGVVAIGVRLIELKGILRGHFEACVRAEFGWSPQWSRQLMQVGQRFGLSNRNSSCDLPSSAKVLAELAAANAPDEVVQQAATEGWTVKEAKQRLSRSTGPRQPSSTEAQALSILKKDGELERLQAAMALAERAVIVTAEDVMAEQRLRDVGKLRHILGEEADFHLRKDGRWIRLPHDGRADVVAVAVEPDLFSQIPMESGDGWETIKVKDAAARIGEPWLASKLTPVSYKARNGNNYFKNGWEARGMQKYAHCQIRRIG